MQDSIKRVALVTGASRGIGFEIASQLARKGMSVLVGARTETEGVEARDRIADQGLDALVNNAGIQIDPETPILELGIALFQNTLETNAFGPLLLCQACVPIMKKNGYGRIVNMSSALGSLTQIAGPDSASAEGLVPCLPDVENASQCNYGFAG